MNTNAYRIGRNPRTTFYELHTDPCRHTARLDEVSSVTGGSAADVAAAFEEANDGCLVTIAPCARRKG